MTKKENLEILEFRDKIAVFINNSDLPIVIKRQQIEQIYSELLKLESNTIQKELKERKEELEQEQKKKNSKNKFRKKRKRR